MGSGDTSGGAGGRVRAVELVRAAISLIRPRLQPLAMIAAVAWIANIGWNAYALPRMTELGFLAQLIASLIAAATGAFLIRAMLTPGAPRWWLPDGGFVGYVGLSTVIGLPVSYFLSGMGETAPADQPPALMLTMIVLLLFTLVASVKLSLWFVGVLIHQFCGPADSWRRTKGATLSAILANLWLTLPPMTLAFLVAAAAGGDPAKHPASPGAIAFTLGAVVASVLSASVTAGLWKVRGEGR